jgi:hypothetical protein
VASVVIPAELSRRVNALAAKLEVDLDAQRVADSFLASHSRRRGRKLLWGGISHKAGCAVALARPGQVFATGK